MFDSLHHFLYSNNVWIVPLALIVAGFFSRRIWVILHAPADAAARPAGRRTPRQLPAAPAAPAKPVQQQFLAGKASPPASVTAGEESRKHKAQAPTIRIRSDDQRPTTIGGTTTEVLPARPDEQSVGDEVGKLFAGLDDALKPASEAGTTAEAPPADSQRRASRLEVLGFHHSIESTRTPPPGTIVAPPETPAPPPAAAAEAPALDDILARLDRVLAEDQPAKAPAAPAEAAAAPAVPAAPAPAPTPAPAADPKPIAKAPVWARADAQDEDLAKPADPGQQLGLFDEDKKA